jgi:aspartate kinase
VIVVKFGGTSVQDADAINRAADIVRSRLDRRPIVVVSALAGATNALLGMAEQAIKGQLIGSLRAVETLRDRHLDQCEALIGDQSTCDEISSELSAMFDELASLVGALNVLGHLTPRSLDAIAAMGEQLSSLLVTAAFRERGIDAELVDSRQVMRTNDTFTKAEPDQDAIADNARRIILPVLRGHRVPVMGGFIGATRDEITTTLGRGGSDYSASLIGAALNADAIEIWTDVDGMLTADPRVVEGAKLIERIRFDEASELASFGAKVLHPSTIAPAVKRNIPVYIYNSRRPEGTGTLIAFDAPRRAVSAIAGKTNITVVKVRASRMLHEYGFLRVVFEMFDRHKTSVDVVATSEVSLSVTVDDAEHLDELLVDLRTLGDVSIERNRGIVAVVGAALSEDGAAMGRAFEAIAGTKVHMASLSATGINLTLIIDGDQVPSAMRRLHDAFFGSAAKAAPAAVVS